MKNLLHFKDYIKQARSMNEFGLDELEDIDDNITETTDELKPKSWNFIKLHLRKHLFSDIVNKGASRNYSTKPNEKMHGPIKQSYLHRSNFKDFAKQVC